jgi:hypothetical protein
VEGKASDVCVPRPLAKPLLFLLRPPLPPSPSPPPPSHAHPCWWRCVRVRVCVGSHAVGAQPQTRRGLLAVSGRLTTHSPPTQHTPTRQCRPQDSRNFGVSKAVMIIIEPSQSGRRYPCKNWWHPRWPRKGPTKRRKARTRPEKTCMNRKATRGSGDWQREP